MPKLWSKTIEEHRLVVREAALDAVAAVVAAEGLAAVNMSRVADATGIGRATLYKYFSDVEALLVAWHERQVLTHMGELMKIHNANASARDKLESVLSSCAANMRERPDHGISAFLHESEHVGHARAHLTTFVAALIAEGAKGGAFRADVGADELAAFCIHAVGAAAVLPSKAAVRRLVSITLGALQPPD